MKSGPLKDNPRRVLLLSHSAQVSGAEQSMLTFLQNADRERHHFTVACPGSGSLVEGLERFGVPVVATDFGRLRRQLSPELVQQSIRLIRTSNRLLRLVRTRRPHLLHANTTMAALHAALAKGRCRVPLLWHVRDLNTPRLVARLICRRADGVIAVSRAVAESLNACARPDSVHVIPNGIDVDHFVPARDERWVRRRFNLPHDAKLVSVVGQLTPWKGHDELLLAWAKVRRRVRGNILLIVGSPLWPEDQAWEAYLKELADRLGLAGSVRFLGQRDDVASIVAASAALVIPSKAEPFGRVALEGMALGKPVVGTDAGGLPEVVADGLTGLLVKPEDAHALASAIERVLSDDVLAKEMGQAGAVRVREHFLSARTTALIQNLYDHVLEKAGGP